MANVAANRKRGRPPLPRARYRGIMNAMLGRIRSGEWPPGTVLPSLRALAKEHGVGTNTVRLALRALRAETRVSGNARGRIIVGPEQRLATVMRAVILEVSSTFFDLALGPAYRSQIQAGIEEGVGAWPATLVLSGNPLYRTAVPEDGLDLPLQGLLLLGHFTRAVLGRYERLRLPVALVDRPNLGFGLHASCVDNVFSAEDATRRLLALGHRRIAFVRYVLVGVREIDPDSVERQEGYVRAMREAGLYRKELLFNIVGSGSVSNESTLRAILAARPPVTAALCVDTGCAALVEQEALRCGRRVPGGLSLAAFQESSAEATRFAGPRTDFREIGRRAVELLKGPRDPARTVRTRTVWADGDTLAPPPHGKAR